MGDLPFKVGFRRSNVFNFILIKSKTNKEVVPIDSGS